MNKTVEQHYRKERKNPRTMRTGFNAADAYRHAVTIDEFERLEAEGLVRFKVVADEDPDLSFLEDEEILSTKKGREYVEQIKKIAREDGCYGIVTEYRLHPESGKWEHGGSCFGFVGRDDVNPEKNCYTPQLMREAINALNQARKSVCPTCHGTGKV